MIEKTVYKVVSKDLRSLTRRNVYPPFTIQYYENEWIKPSFPSFTSLIFVFLHLKEAIAFADYDDIIFEAEADKIVPIKTELDIKLCHKNKEKILIFWQYKRDINQVAIPLGTVGVSKIKLIKRIKPPAKASIYLN